MKHFDSTLLREKFIISDVLNVPDILSDPEQKSPPAKSETVIALSNRMVLPLRDDNGKEVEEFIIRSKTMHSCVRMAGLVMKEYLKNGALHDRLEQDDFASLWDVVMTPYERENDPDHWCAVYYRGKPIFQSKDHHAFLDVIEKILFQHDCDYDQSIVLAEKAFMKAGKKVDITHDGKVAAIFDVNEERTKCGIIIRSPKKTTTCNMQITPKGYSRDHVIPAFILCAEFLEGLHYSFIVGYNEVPSDQVHSKDPDIRAKVHLVQKSKDRIVSIQGRIGKIEEDMVIHYRPEKPSFKTIIHEALSSRED